MTVTVWVIVFGAEPVHTTSICCVYTLAEVEANRAKKADMFENFIVKKDECQAIEQLRRKGS